MCQKDEDRNCKKGQMDIRIKKTAINYVKLYQIQLFVAASPKEFSQPSPRKILKEIVYHSIMC